MCEFYYPIAVREIPTKDFRPSMPMPSSMKLTYFDVRGRTEIARLILAYAGVDYQDERLTGQTANILFLNFCNLVLITKPLYV